MYNLYDARSGAILGTITEEQLQFMRDQLEEESTEDQDYYINHVTVATFQQRGGDPQLIALLQNALANQAEMDIRWEPA